MFPKPFQYKVPKYDRLERARRFQREKEDEGLTSFVNSEPASEIEERFARALRKTALTFDFQYEVNTAFSLPHQQRFIDFVVYLPPPMSIEIDGGIAHKTIGDKEADRIRDATIDDALRNFGFLPIERIDGDKLLTQEGADAVVSDLF